MNSSAFKLIFNYLDLITIGLTAAPELLAIIQKNRELFAKWISDGRDPSEEEFEELQKAIEKLREDLHNTPQ